MWAVWSHKVMPDCMLIERAEKYNVRDINSVNMFSDSGSSRQRWTLFQFLWAHYERSWSVQTAKSFRRIVTISIGCPVFIGNTHVLARSDTALLEPCLFPSKVELIQNSGVIARFSRKDFTWLGSVLEDETLVNILSLLPNSAKWLGMNKLTSKAGECRINTFNHMHEHQFANDSKMHIILLRPIHTFPSLLVTVSSWKVYSKWMTLPWQKLSAQIRWISPSVGTSNLSASGRVASTQRQNKCACSSHICDSSGN